MVDPTPTSTPLTYARRALNRTQPPWVDIKVDHMSLADALYWDATMQRDIVTEGLNARRLGKPPPRADFYWTWSGIRMLFPLAQVLKKRRCRALTIYVQDSKGRALPAGMMLLIERYPWALSAPTPLRSVFTWFIASAPAASLVVRGVPDPPAVGRIMIDAALVTSQALGLQGRMWLHAAPSGGTGLVKFYGTVCQMEHLPIGAPLPGGQLSDGRHFYATSVLAKQLIDALQLAR